MPKVLVLGADGMLGSMVAAILGRDPSLEVTATTRRGSRGDPAIRGRFDVESARVGALLDRERCEWIVNAIGVIKPRIDERETRSVENAIAVNALFPHRLAAASAERGIRVIQIATDGVFSGANAPYDESAPHDPLDVYGKTKSLGEVPAAHVIHLRCSIIGPEPSGARSFLGWALSARPDATLTGYTAQHWNGVTTLHFAKVCAAVIGGVQVPHSLHLVPADRVTKAELLELVLSAYGRDDVSVLREAGPQPVDRTLTTCHPEINQRLWRAAGYADVPTVAEMVHELAAHETGRVAS